MNVRLQQLDLRFRKATVTIPFSPQLTFVHGQVGTGKSSIARLVDWCLGDEMDYTPALEDELVSANLHLQLADHAVLIQRNREDKTHVRLSWSISGEEPESESVKLQGSAEDWDPATPQSLSDYLFHLSGLTPLRVPRSRKRKDSPLQRLSFRDFLAFCYLPQENLNVSLLRFGEAFKERKSEDVMRAILGLFSELQQQLQAKSDALLQQSNRLSDQADQVTEFLDRLEIDSLADLENLLAAARRELALARQARSSIGAQKLPIGHPSEALREQLRALDKDLAARRQGLADVEERIERDQRLRAELITTQLKQARANVAVEILSGVKYGHCPQCGSVVGPPSDDNHCHLCRSDLSDGLPSVPDEASEADLEARVDELAESVERHRAAKARELRHLRDREAVREELDTQLVEVLREYESKRLGTVREVERRVALARTQVERLEAADRLRREVRRLRDESQKRTLERTPVLEALKAENERLTEREHQRELIAEAFHEALLQVGLPDVTKDDVVLIGDDLQPRVEPASGRAAYGFKTLGSSGMKTLFQCCYVLAIHRVAAENELLLPRFLIIDTPTQHVDEQVDSELFHGFFRYLYALLEGPMSSVQVVLIDSDYVPPPPTIQHDHRLMLRDDPAHPRLVPYYDAPESTASGGDSE